MFKILPILLSSSSLLVAAWQRPDPVTYTSRPPSEGVKNGRQVRIDTANDNVICTRSDGRLGECVPYYLCNENRNASVNYAGVIVLIYRDGSCSSAYDTCCLPFNKRPSNQPILPVLPRRTGCGWANPNGVDLRNTSGINGETKFGEFPWMVAILNRDPESENQGGPKLNIYFGGGSLIHPSVVLTAAHVVQQNKALKIRAGEWDTQSDKEIFPSQERDVASVQIHEDFIKGNLFYDIAVLFLVQPVELTPNVGIVCLPPPRITQYEGTRCVATGWGKDRFGKEGQYAIILKKVELPVVNHVKCQEALRKTRLGDLFDLHFSFMCAGGEPGKDTCTGDGGSPLSCPMEYEKDRYVQSGIVAWGVGCGDDGTPGVYVDVSVVRNWIDDKVVGKGYDTRVYTRR